jgi:predicted RNA-binding Zn-ribbon protein involved in translation (DUF1610 family)
MVSTMGASYICADCDLEFVAEEEGDDPRCPKCGRTEAVEPSDTSTLQSDIWRQWLVVFALLFIAGIAYVLFE